MISSELSDEQVLYQRGKWEVTERVIEPLEMSDTDTIDFFSEYFLGSSYVGGGKWSVTLDGFIQFQGDSFRDAVSKAAAYHKERNQ